MLALGAFGGCARRLDLSLALASDSCTIIVPAGGSILYETSTARGDAGRAFCGGCLAVGTQLDSHGAIASFLRTNAPSCAGVEPASQLVVRVTAWSVPGCPEPPAPRLFCAESQPVTLPDGREDAVVVAVLTCDATCSTTCKPATCAALGKNCDMISDGCNGMLACGDCRPPEKCGGAGVPNVCGK
jgi:hypothetical protein